MSVEIYYYYYYYYFYFIYIFFSFLFFFSVIILYIMFIVIMLWAASIDGHLSSLPATVLICICLISLINSLKFLPSTVPKICHNAERRSHTSHPLLK